MSEPENIPTTIGRYEVKRLLGGGAMGYVWLAEDPRIKRKVAVKTMRTDNLRNEADRVECLARFQREAEVSGLLNHPSIVTIYDVGESELGPFLAMEFIQGKPLDALLKGEHGVSLTDKLKIIASIAEALDHAHVNGVIHRDVKPGNVMIGDDGRAKLMDFGIAKREDASLTQTGTFLGTPSYASPEQIREGTVDNRSDIFSFGVMVFEILSGSTPFPGNSINTILYRIVNEPPVEVEPPVMGLMPDGWKRVFNKVLAKSPADRHPTCAAFIRDLMDVTTAMPKDERRELLGILHVPSGEPSLPPLLSKAHDETTLVPTRPVPSRGRSVLMIAAAAILALGGGGAWLFLKGRGGESVQVATNPAGARILVDGKAQEGLSPLPISLRPGARLRVERKGYEPVELEFAPGKLAQPLDLKPLVTEVKVESAPSGAQVNFDGQMLKERTPVKIKWDQSRLHKLTLTADGGLGFAHDYEAGDTPEGKLLPLVPSGGKQEEVDASTPGFLRVAGSFSVRIKVDGRDAGELGAKGLPLKPGTFRIELSAPKVFYKDTRSVTIRPGQTSPWNLPELARLTVNSFPGTGMVTVDGIPTGVESDGNTPIAMVLGPHVIGFEGKGAKQNVDLKGDQPLKIKL